MKVLITTHSSRFFDSNRANLNALNNRCDARPFDNLPDIASFGSWNEAIAVQGKIAFWRIDYNCGKRVSAKLLTCVEPAVQPAKRMLCRRCASGRGAGPDHAVWSRI